MLYSVELLFELIEGLTVYGDELHGECFVECQMQLQWSKPQLSASID